MSLSIQKQEFLSHYVANGLRNGAKAARAAGFTASTARIRASRILREPEAQAAILEEQKWLQQKHHITTDTAVQMLLESHRKAATATEEVAAIREIAKMLGLYQPEKKQMDSVDIHKIEQLAQMSDEELLKLADLPVVDLF